MSICQIFNIKRSFCFLQSYLPQFANESNTKSIIKYPHWNSSQCVCFSKTWKKSMGSKRSTKDWIFRQQRKGGRQGQQEMEWCWFVHGMESWFLWGAHQRLVLGKDVPRGWGEQSATVDRHLQGQWMGWDNGDSPLGTMAAVYEGLSWFESVKDSIKISALLDFINLVSMSSFGLPGDFMLGLCNKSIAAHGRRPFIWV